MHDCGRGANPGGETAHPILGTPRARPIDCLTLRRGVIAATILLCVLAATAIADSCDTLTGNIDCNRGRQNQYSAGGSQARHAGERQTIQARPFQGLGGELSNAEPPATLGAITFGGDGRRCSGLFRTTRC
jgi:hypothetical protein